ncbi:MAG: hypothetical protein OSA51_10870 [Octadecabacter sp.]|nr:hypothetical protein [Octadecabacter sp.]
MTIIFDIPLKDGASSRSGRDRLEKHLFSVVVSERLWLCPKVSHPKPSQRGLEHLLYLIPSKNSPMQYHIA